MPTPGSVQRTYLVLLLGNTLAASLIWGINTIFLLDAGLSNLEAFAANAFFTAGMVIFEVPTGVVADTVGRRASYLLGTVTLAASTLLYVLLWRIHAPFWQWAVVSMLIGLGFTFFSGAVEAWLVDALKATGFTGELEAGFGRGPVGTGVAVVTGVGAGGLGGRRADRPGDESWNSLRSPRSHSRRDVRSGLQADARCRVLSREGWARADRDTEDRLGLNRVRPPGTVGPLADDRVPVHRRRRHLRFLCSAAVPAETLR